MCSACLVADKVTGLAAERLARSCHGAKPDRPRPAILEYGQVDHGDVHLRRQLGERHPALGEHVVEPHPDGGRLDGRPVAIAGGGLGSLLRHTVPWISSSMSAPCLMMRAKVSSAAPASAGTGSRARTGSLITSPKWSRATSMVLSSWSRANPCTAAAATLPAMISQPSRRMATATWTVNG